MLPSPLTIEDNRQANVFIKRKRNKKFKNFIQEIKSMEDKKWKLSNY